MQPRVARALTLLAVAAMPALASAQVTSAMDPAAFADHLDRLTQQLSSGAPGEVPQLAVPAAWTVEWEGERFEMPALWLQRALDTARRNPATWPAQRQAILGQLAALKTESEALRSRDAARLPSETDARNALNGVLAGREDRQMAQQSAMAQLRRQMVDWLARVWERLGGGRLGRRSTAIGLAWISVLVALGLLSAWLIRLSRRSGGLAMSLEGPDVRRHSARAWARDALAAANGREVLRCAYRATVIGIADEGAWRHDDARTPREYLRMLAPDHRRGALAADVLRRFEQVWFGAREATDDDRRAVLARLRELGCLPGD